MARTNYTDRLNKLCAEKDWTSQLEDISPEAHGDDPCDLFARGKVRHSRPCSRRFVAWYWRSALVSDLIPFFTRQDPKRSRFYKTAMCQNMTETGHCSYNEKGHCVFAHSEEEKRPMPTLLRNWKFKISIIDGTKRIKSVENDQTHHSKKFAQEEAIRALLQLLDDDERRREEPAAGPPPSASSAKDFPGLHDSSPATAPRQSASVDASPSDNLPGLGASASAAPGQSAWASGPPTAWKTPAPQAVVWPSLATKPLPPLPPLGAWARTTAPAPGECHEAAAAQEESEAAARAEQPEDARSCSSQLSTPTSTSNASTVLDERRREEPAAGPPPSASSAKDFPGLHDSSPATAPRQSASVDASPSDNLPGLGASASAAPGQSAWASGPPTAWKTPAPQAVVWPSLATKPLPPLPPLGAWARTTAPAPGECHEAAAAQEESEAAARAEQPEDARSCSSQLSTPTSTSNASTVLDEPQFAQDGELDKDAEIERLKKLLAKYETEYETLKDLERIRLAKLEADNQVLREKVEALQGATDAVQPTQDTPEGSSGSPRSSGSHGKARHERSPSIKERGWNPKRQKKHYILSRWAIVEDQETKQLKLEKQTETVSKTPSDRRSSLNCEASFKRDDRGVKAFLTPGADRDAIERKLGEINSAQERASQLDEEAYKAEVEKGEVERKLSELQQWSAQQEDFISSSWSELESDASVVRLCL
jgi:hypothetical protein